jgi:hypothetical protein
VTFTHFATLMSKAVPALQALHDLTDFSSVIKDSHETHLAAAASHAWAALHAVAVTCLSLPPAGSCVGVCSGNCVGFGLSFFTVTLTHLAALISKAVPGEARIQIMSCEGSANCESPKRAGIEGAEVVVEVFSLDVYARADDKCAARADGPANLRTFVSAWALPCRCDDYGRREGLPNRDVSLTICYTTCHIGEEARRRQQAHATAHCADIAGGYGRILENRAGQARDNYAVLIRGTYGRTLETSLGLNCQL